MRFAVLLTLAIAGLTITPLAQKQKSVKTPPSHSEEKKDKGKSTARVPRKKEEGGGLTSSAQELRKAEQSSTKVSRKTTKDAKTPRNASLVKAKKKDGNAPIHFGASGGGHKTSGKSKDPLKGRMKHKGRR